MSGHRYRIVVRGRLSDRFSSAFAGMTLEQGDRTTALVGPVADQSHLFGLLERVRSLGLDLVRVEEEGSSGVGSTEPAVRTEAPARPAPEQEVSS
jgi:hypothetical protein